MISFKKKRKAHLQLGRLGENDACALLKAKGLEILSRNWKSASGELDIVARDGATMVFVEVKTLRKSHCFRPAINFKVRQARRNLHAARRYLRIIGYPAISIRFDFIEVVRGRFLRHSIRHYKNFLPQNHHNSN